MSCPGVLGYEQYAIDPDDCGLLTGMHAIGLARGASAAASRVATNERTRMVTEASWIRIVIGEAFSPGRKKGSSSFYFYAGIDLISAPSI
jgi:hypothetical protein